MSRLASPIPHTTPPSTTPPSLDDDPPSLDLFADISHHGSSVYEFLAQEPPTLPSFPPPPHPSVPPSAFPPPLPSQQVDSYCTDFPPTSSILSSHSTIYQTATPPPPSHPHPPSNRHPKTRKPRSKRNPALKKPISKSRPASSEASLQKPSESSHITTECLPSSTPSKPSPHRLKQENLPNDTDPSDASDLAASTQSKQTPLSSIPTPSAHPTPPYAPDPPSKDTHNSHTRRCRAKVNLKFAELLSVLPAPPPKAGIKHKAQILDYTINVFRDILARKTLLEAELTLSSKTHLNNWVDNVVNHSMSIQEALAPYLSLICTKGKWKYSEIWVPSQEPLQNLESSAVTVESVSGDSQLLAPPNPIQDPQFRLRLALGVIPSLPNSEEPDLQAKLERFRDRSRSFGCKASVDLPGRIMCTMRPEWLPSLEDQHAFQRAKLAREASLVICFGVPIFVRGHVAAVAVFFDTEQRAYDAPCVDLADHVAGLLGNSFGASIVKRAASK